MFRAGVIPYSIIDNQYYFLLGAELNGLWNDFGGLVELKDRNIIQTAAREAFEESMGLLGSQGELEVLLEHVPSVIGDFSTTFFLKMNHAEFITLSDHFDRSLTYLGRCIRGCPEGYFEKLMIRWFTEEDLKKFQVHPGALMAIQVFKV